MRAFFSNAANHENICEKLRASSLQCAQCEETSVSPHSPGAIRNDEALARQIFSPHQINPDTGEPNAAAFTDAEKIGMSVDRLPVCGILSVHRRGSEKQAADRERKTRTDIDYLGFIASTCGAIRSLLDEKGERQFVVLDTATTANTAHADVCHMRFKDTKAKKDARTALMSVFGKLQCPTA